MNNVDVLPQWAGLSVSGGRLNVFKAAQAAVACTEKFQVTDSNRPAANEFAITWPAVPGMRYQVFASVSLTSVFTSLSGVIVCGEGQSTLTFTDLAATEPEKFYQVRIVP
jgi:hypothetical protein